MFSQQRWMVVAAFFCLMGWVCADRAIGADPVDQAAPGESAVTMTQFDTVQLNVQSTDLINVLQLLSVQGRKNIVPSPKVTGSVTANLYDVTFHEALDAICQQNGCGYIEKGNFIYIYTLEEIQQIQQAQRKVEHRVFQLNYITAQDASTFITPLLSGSGSVAISGNVGTGFQPTIADGGANSSSQMDNLLIRDYPENLDEIAKVIEQLDTKPYQVLVEATIFQADVSENAAFGVDLAILGDIAVDAFSNPLAGIGDLFGETPNISTDQAQIMTSTVGQVHSGQGGLKAGIVTNNVAAFIRALDSVTDTVVLANPKLMVLNRQRAEVLIGKKVGYLSTTATSTATTQTVEFLDTGTQLTLRPFVAREGDDFVIRLELKPQVSEAEIRNVVPGTSTTAVTVPDEITQELTTNVMVRNGQTVVLGGLYKEKTEIAREQVPVLGDVPIVGNAFKGRDDATERSEVIFVITSHVVKDKALYAAGAAALDGAEMKLLGARSGLLPWARSKMTASHLRDALKALENDDREKALWEVDMALSLQPQRIEAIRLKEKLTGQRVYWPESSLFEQAVEVMIEQQTGLRKQQRRARPMQPDPRPGEPVSDSEPLTGISQTQPVFPEAVTEQVFGQTAEQTVETIEVAEQNQAVETTTQDIDTEAVAESQTEQTLSDQAAVETDPAFVDETVAATEEDDFNVPSDNGAGWGSMTEADSAAGQDENTVAAQDTPDAELEEDSQEGVGAALMNAVEHYVGDETDEAIERTAVEAPEVDTTGIE